MVAMFRIRFPPRRIGLLILLVGFMWGVTFLNVTYMNNYSVTPESEKLKNEIINLSEQYVKALARENGEVVDGPYAGRFTAYDLKRTMAVLLESILQRLHQLEFKVNGVINGSISVGNTSQQLATKNQNSQHKMDAKDVIMGKVEKCVLTQEDKQTFPNCEGKLMWMRYMWKSDPCYAQLGVDGTDCSFFMYLSEVEGWCPRKPWQGKRANVSPEVTNYAKHRSDLNGLMKLLVDPNERKGYAFIRQRITRMWPEWVKGIQSLAKKPGFDTRPIKKVIVHLGLLTKQTGFKIAEMQFKGGPLGELVQWSDLIATLYLLGHQLTITSEVEQLSGILSKLPSAGAPCQNRKDLPIDLMYTDIVGLRQFRKKVQGGYAKFSCLLRVVDSFGTEPAFNHKNYAKTHKILSVWGGQDLKPQQFFTMFPHTPDNSFMGFVVDRYLPDDKNTSKIERKNQGLVYGKQEYMWQGHANYLSLIRNHVEIHGTVSIGDDNKRDVVPPFVINHGIMGGEELHRLLRQTKIFIGMGFPYEGPAPLEAIANGAVFLNPSFNPPHNSQNNKFFKGKPTLRSVSSQHPYAESFIGEPYVYTIDMKNSQLVEKTVAKILSTSKFESYLPFEYTQEGMLQRMNAYLEHQNFCMFQRQPTKWPPPNAVKAFLADAGMSCKEYCYSKDLICEPSYFLVINTKAEFESRDVKCSSETYESDIYHPSVDVGKVCRLQKDEMLFSCAGEKENVRRLCPCRTYMKGQTALCATCT
ncbi:alpha-1,6-mannosylglycoprotein 6-beta-N-acetylglucosaminyltransferase A-like [Liolophura sinensis]|uniref:alpha-1,6-mannosylglycoprotein 6-beta-N-acetylglucosaminyltransferase A-like n=1 Tax=Liolophura sinensis TaxID=3198878 RepID=UPI003159095F